MSDVIHRAKEVLISKSINHDYLHKDPLFNEEVAQAILNLNKCEDSDLVDRFFEALKKISELKNSESNEISKSIINKIKNAKILFENNFFDKNFIDFIERNQWHVLEILADNKDYLENKAGVSAALKVIGPKPNVARGIFSLIREGLFSNDIVDLIEQGYNRDKVIEVAKRLNSIGVLRNKNSELNIETVYTSLEKFNAKYENLKGFNDSLGKDSIQKIIDNLEMEVIDNSGGGLCGDKSIFIGILPQLKKEIDSEKKDSLFEKIYLNYKEIYDSLYFNKNPKLTKEQFRNRIYYFDLYQQDETLLTEVSLSFRQMIRKSYGKEIFDNFGKNLKLCEQIKNKCEQITNKDKVLISTLKDILKKVIKCRKSLGDKLIPEVNIESLKTTGAVKKEIDHQIQKMEIDVYGYKISATKMMYMQSDPARIMPPKELMALEGKIDASQELNDQEKKELNKLALSALELVEDKLFTPWTLSIYSKVSTEKYLDQNIIEYRLTKELDLKVSGDGQKTGTALTTDNFLLNHKPGGRLKKPHFQTKLTKEDIDYCQSHTLIANETYRNEFIKIYNLLYKTDPKWRIQKRQKDFSSMSSAQISEYIRKNEISRSRAAFNILKLYGSHDMNKKVVNAAIGEYHRLNKLGLIKKGSVQSTAYLRKDRYINNFISSSVAPEKVQQRVNKKSTTLLHDKHFEHIREQTYSNDVIEL
ncbi:hypothetical protein PsalN5692_00048 [Piscirickettsia salmonis]|uniref:hypothetical protein n=2 Tax=Piscirickettsia salmonis TaxID=1238 RepID=UPI0012B8D1E7|nr:hypothetical protein [Piscirickettsia salmonis]QGP48649.1 hypothetical protein PsalN5692_00048 [Piscirickettsia salmonis]